ncbi:DNA modification methylase [Spirochaetia bacterium]|nr:DNA modification methylase [Spirochaetia bacterium]
MLDNIEFKDYKKKDDIHGTVLYPAVMVAPVQKKILGDIILKDNIVSIFDPFHGSGTALYEAFELSSDMHLVGCDINPLANLITRVKLQGVSKFIYSDINKIEEYINEPDYVYEYSFPNIEKWFRSDVIDSLALLRSAIMNINSDRNRLYFWYILSDVIRFNSNTRSSTYKLHIKEKNVIENMENNVINSFLSKAKKYADKFKHKSENFILYKNDIFNVIKKIRKNAFDISITSPPYGDNATTVPYGQFSMLSLYTIPEYDLELEGWELNNYSIIDNRSMGGSEKSVMLDKFELSLIKNYLSLISTSKHQKILRYFNDYFSFLKELCRVTKKYIVLTLGNRTVDRIEINLVSLTKKFMEKNNYKNIDSAMRIIPRKRTPKVTSNVRQKPVSSMNYEYILIYKKYV